MPSARAIDRTSVSSSRSNGADARSTMRVPSVPIDADIEKESARPGMDATDRRTFASASRSTTGTRSGGKPRLRIT